MTTVLLDIENCTLDMLKTAIHIGKKLYPRRKTKIYGFVKKRALQMDENKISELKALYSDITVIAAPINGKNAADMTMIAYSSVLCKKESLVILCSSDGDLTFLPKFLQSQNKKVIGVGNPNVPISTKLAYTAYIETHYDKEKKQTITNLFSKETFESMIQKYWNTLEEKTSDSWISHKNIKEIGLPESLLLALSRETGQTEKTLYKRFFDLLHILEGFESKEDPKGGYYYKISHQKKNEKTQDLSKSYHNNISRH